MPADEWLNEHEWLNEQPPREGRGGSGSGRRRRRGEQVASGVEGFCADAGAAEHPSELLNALFFVERTDARMSASVF